MKLLKITLFILCSITASISADVPRGYKTTDSFEESLAKAKEKSRLLAVLVKGSDDDCPNCATTIENGTKAIKSSCQMIFTRVKHVQKGQSKLPKEITDQMTNLTGGSSVEYFIFNPETFELIARGSRKHLQSNKKLIREFKNKVRTAKKDLE